MDIDVDTGIDLLEITKFNYRTLFNKSTIKISDIQKWCLNFFGIENISDVDLEPQSQKLYFKDHPDEWKKVFIFFCGMPFTEYEFQGVDGNLLNSYTLHNMYPSHGTDNVLIETFSEMEFNLQNILQIDIFSSNFNQQLSKRIVTKLLGVCFKENYMLVTDISSTDKDYTSQLGGSSYKN